jgi:hypothetical protein
MIFNGGKERENSPSFGLKKWKTAIAEKCVNFLTQKPNKIRNIKSVESLTKI